MKTGTVTWTQILLLMTIVLWATTSWSAKNSAANQGNALYLEGHYEEAISQYEKLQAQGFDNGYLYFNLGNAYYRSGDLPRSILSYAKAHMLLPREDFIEANLEFVLSQTENQLDGRKTHPAEPIFFWMKDLNLKEHAYILFWINLAFWGVMTAGLHLRSESIITGRNILLALLLLCIGSSGFRWQKEHGSPFGVIANGKASVHAEPNSDSPVMFQLDTGALVSINHSNKEWLKLELTDNREGWITNKHILR